MSQELTFADFAKINRQRCESETGFNHKLSDWVVAVTGELGEAANIVKKLNRVRDGIPGNRTSKEALKNSLRKELGDVFIYLDLLAQSLEFQIVDAAIEVFNEKSDQLKCPLKMPSLK